MRSISALLFLAFLLPLSSSASLPDFGPPPPEPPPEIPEGLVSCFDHYTFGSITVSLEGNTETIAAGSIAELSGTVSNTNDYPVSGVKLYAKLFKNDGVEKSVQGPDVIDEFLVVDLGAFGRFYETDGATLLAGESRPFSFRYSLPPALVDGAYQFALYAVSEERFNMAGLSFTDDVVGGLYPFTVVGGGSGNARFDRSSFTVAGRAHQFAAYPSALRPSENSALIEGRLVNNTPDTISGTLTWTLYKWDQRKGRNAIETRTQELSVSGGSSAVVTYELVDARFPVYQLIGRFESNRGPSVVGLRITREGIDEPRINYSGFDATDDGWVAFGCIHNTGSSFQIEDNTVIVSGATKGLFTRTLFNERYDGPITGALSAVVTPVSFFLPESRIVIETALIRGGVPVDVVESEYTCEELGVCGPVSLETLVWIILALIIIGGGAWLLRRKRASSNV